jgi:hypothetical protein
MDEDGDDETLLLATLEQLYRQQALINELFLTFSPLVPDSNAVYDAMMREEDRLNWAPSGSDGIRSDWALRRPDPHPHNPRIIADYGAWAHGWRLPTKNC